LPTVPTLSKAESALTVTYLCVCDNLGRRLGCRLEVDVKTLRLGTALLASLAFAACGKNSTSHGTQDLGAPDSGAPDSAAPDLAVPGSGIDGGGVDGPGPGDGGGVGGTGLNGSGTACSTSADCTGGQICTVIGACACPPYQDLCNGTCIPTANDPQNCGHCGVMCTGTSACYGGKCNPGGCPAGLTACSNACVDTSTDNNNCGNGMAGCGHKCVPTSGGQQTGCVGGTCVPVAGSTTGGPSMCPSGGVTVTNGSGSSTCAGFLASNTFTFALCSCTSLNNTGNLSTDGFDSLRGPYPSPAPAWPYSLGAGVGSNGSVSNDSSFNVGGSLFCSGSASGGSSYDVRQDLHVGGTASLTATVGGNAYLSSGGGGLNVKGHTYTGVTTLPPCQYCPGQTPGPIDVASFVAARVTNSTGSNNDNKTINLSDTLFSSGSGPSRLDLPCGNYYLDGITRDALIYAHGHTALYVGTKGITAGNVTFSLDPTASFDIFVGGPITNGGSFTMGAQNYPSLTRMYVAGTGTLTFSSSANIYGNLYDAGHIGLSSGTTVYGALYAGSLDGSADLTIHYDRQVVVQGATCPPPNMSMPDGGTSVVPDGGTSSGPDGGTIPPTGCGSCKDCNNQACINGTCGACTDSSQCCPPLLCTNGTCALVIL
jgi:hypothetical protein